MFGFGLLWGAVKRLAASIHVTADLFDAANERLRERLDLMDDPAEAPLLTHEGNGTAERLDRLTKPTKARTTKGGA